MQGPYSNEWHCKTQTLLLFLPLMPKRGKVIPRQAGLGWNCSIHLLKYKSKWQLQFLGLHIVFAWLCSSNSFRTLWRNNATWNPLHNSFWEWHWPLRYQCKNLFVGRLEKLPAPSTIFCAERQCGGIIIKQPNGICLVRAVKHWRKSTKGWLNIECRQKVVLPRKKGNCFFIRLTSYYHYQDIRQQNY